MDYSHTSPTMSAPASTPAPADPKTVRFQLISPESPHTTARLPMRVQIYPHDATDSIVTTVKNFYGLYSSPTSSKGVSFEDENGNTMIARYENFRDKMVVYVRVIEEPAMSPSAFATRNYHSPPALGAHHPYAAAANTNGTSDAHVYHGQHSPPSQAYPNGDANGSHNSPSTSTNNSGNTSSYFAPVSSLHHFHHLQEHHGEHINRPGSRTSRKRSSSPGAANGDRRSMSTNSKNRSRSSKARGVNGSSQHSDGYGPDSMAGYSSGDGAPSSNSSRMKEQQPIGNTEISLENIVEGGRRKRAKFESSELPLFAPPQMPAATSNPSVSPARRSDHRPSLPYVLPGQNPFSGAGALHSPQHYNTHFGQGGVYATPGSDRRHTRASFGYSSAGLVGLGMGILPTPDPTVSSLSEEDKDVAMQLMRLGEISNFGRTSTSTQDDTFSGHADAASSTGATSDSESESGGDDGDDFEEADEESALHAASRKQQRLDLVGGSRKIYQSVEPADDDSADIDYKESARMMPSVPSVPLISTVASTVTSVPITNGLMAAPKIKKVTKASGSAASKLPRPQAAKTKAPKAPKQPKAGGAAKGKKALVSAAPNANGNIHSTVSSAVPMSPASLPPSRKLSVSSVGSGVMSAATAAAIVGMTEEDITDLSSKPRCQRCRKSKKGCDRQRPCGRCRDAGLPADQCVSEDEGNGRKGRYGRHMNIPIKKENGVTIEAPPGPMSANGASSNGMQPPPPPVMQAHAQVAQGPSHGHSHSHSHSHSHGHSHSHSHSQSYSFSPSHVHMQSQSAIPPPSYHAPPVMPMQSPSQMQSQAQSQQLPSLQQQNLPQPHIQPQPQPQPQPIKSLPSLLPPAHISSTPIIAPTIPAMMAASAEKSKKRKR